MIHLHEYIISIAGQWLHVTFQLSTVHKGHDCNPTMANPMTWSEWIEFLLKLSSLHGKDSNDHIHHNPLEVKEMLVMGAFISVYASLLSKLWPKRWMIGSLSPLLHHYLLWHDRWWRAWLLMQAWSHWCCTSNKLPRMAPRNRIFIYLKVHVVR